MFERKEYKLFLGDCLEKLDSLEENSVDAIVTDPPYGLAFMNKKWDYDIPSVDIWKKCLRVLKPGGYLLSFGGSRTYHRIAVNIEDAGFEIRDTIMWVYGSGFPKSHNIGLKIDKKFGHPDRGRAIPAASTHFPNGRYAEDKEKLTSNKVEQYEAKTELGKKYNGYGTALKPAHEPIIMARKPFKGTVTDNVLQYGTGAINIDGCRVGDEIISTHNAPPGTFAGGEPDRGSDTNSYSQHTGRWPANFIHDGSQEVLELFPETKSGKMTSEHNRHTDGSPNGIYGKFDVNHPLSETYGDSGSAARFFYCAKTTKIDRNEGCESLEEKQYSSDGRKKEIENAFQRNKSVSYNNHPTVKPTELMRYLVRLVTPSEGIVLDPFLGSGSTGKAALLEGMKFIGIEREEDFYNIAEKRISFVYNKDVS